MNEKPAHGMLQWSCWEDLKSQWNNGGRLIIKCKSVWEQQKICSISLLSRIGTVAWYVLEADTSLMLAKW